MGMKIKRISLVVFLFLFLFVVIGNSLHLNPGGALLAAATGTPLLVYLFNRRSAQGNAEECARAASRSPARVHRVFEGNADDWVGREHESVGGSRV